MKTRRKHPGSIVLYQWAMTMFLVLIVFGFAAMFQQQMKFSEALTERQLSMQLVAELRQSSNDLSRLARTYLITGNPRFKYQFQAVHEIREGVRPRPPNYSLAYWDTQGLTLESYASPLREKGQATPLIELMRQTGISDQEFNKLQRSIKKSDQLVEIEKQAIALHDEDTPPDPSKVEQALAMLASETFLLGKANVMNLIVEAEQAIINRTEEAIEEAGFWLKVMMEFLVVSGLLLLLLILMTGRHLRRIIGGTVPELQSIIRELGDGDFLTPINVNPKRANSIIGWLAKTQRKLAALNLGHFKAIIESSEDAIASKTIEGIITSWNTGAEKIFGYSAAEIIGRPMTTIIPRERLHEEPEILRKIIRGEKVEHFITQRQHKNGTLVDISVTISPIYSSLNEVIGASKIARDITAKVAAEAEIKRLAFFDALTGVANRRLLHDRLEQMYALCTRENSHLMVVFIDLDNFKPLNDTHGHEAGDALLKQVASRLMSCTRKSDTVARYGGDEFVILLRGPERRQDADMAWADAILTKIRKTLSEPYTVVEITHLCTSSIGVSQLSERTAKAIDLISQADQAMYSAKKLGKNALQYYSSLPKTSHLR